MFRNLRRTISKRNSLYCISVACVCPCLYFLISSEATGKAPTWPQDRKLILDWTTFWGNKLVDGQTLNEMECPITNCEFSNDRSMLKYSDAVLFHWADVNSKEIPRKMMKQRWIMYNFENPFHVHNDVLESMKDSIDWTVTYRRDSDYPFYYGRIRSRKPTDPPPVPVPDRDTFKQKKDIAWMVSHCEAPSQRDFLTRELEKFIDVDIYGKCNGGDMSLIEISKDQAYREHLKVYKLYLSFENALCRDYVTEKVFFPLKYGLIPVVLGGANYDEILPHNSYIDVKNFPSLRDLVTYLKKVIQDYDLYASYFEWRKKYYVQRWDLVSKYKYLCDICARLNSDREYNVERNVSLTSWWEINSDCVSVSEDTFHLANLHEKISALYEKH